MNWQGIDEKEFTRYQTWVNRQGNYCGSYAAAVLLAYYQDQHDPAIIPSYLRSVGSQQEQALVALLKLIIQPFGFPTLPIELSMGLNRYFRRFAPGFRVRQTSIGAWQRVKKRLATKQPLIVGLSKKKGSTYGNHWVVAYAYAMDEKGEYYIKAHDLWGNSAAIIPVKWLSGTVSFPPIAQ
ncbi:hypothetical protein [Enterococcus columbae]|uniref:Peptidase C39-like domain-containing protein n=1 Tax=Enterococcus columbae DSM 7374 = ATCC 51263 TaxID=1121865 RepID=S0KIG0_9ENTE|nr:hypothetical protein [Enterococcus columbae]EOT39908.1 hypothetical protein OMW_01697 [Enterococcus columbae DSM 7374 = ATCC 51263]EOW83893.1 hypothetical protein I568_01340 [Enterococcus columbae DSM 7374 = ATCC 51263]OJG20547.1 hypothetical protein RR47_GL001686 [Enterococcus columbae DSM 7374 = ATCC 51263]